MRVRWGLLIGVAVSVSIHVALVTLVPPPAANVASPEEPYHVVELRRMEIPLPDLPPPSRTPSAKKPDIGRPPLLPAPERPRPPRPRRAGLSLEEMALTARLPDVKTPLPSPSIPVPEPVATAPLLPPERIGRGEAPQGTPEGTQSRGELRVPASLSDLEVDRLDGLKTLRERLIREELGKSTEAGPDETEIRGPAASRDLVFRPPQPTVPPEVEGEVELKFWVLPDGTVGRILLLRRGPLALEKAAVRNLKQWKFNSLPLGSGEPEQWGTVRFRFLSAAAGTRFPPQER
ncbi:MAG: TonB family protein [Nitrospinota bacterium]